MWFRALVILLLAWLAGCKDFRDGYDRGYKARFAQKFVATCKPQVVKKGAPISKAQSYCECAANGLTAKYTPAQLSAIVGVDESPELDAVIQGCIRQELRP